MRSLSGNQIREDFLRFFESKGHRRVHSSSLIPANDPTLLFTNAGMNQFKDVFLGAETRPYTRAASSQKCVRAGGKHNDLENVGFTRRHHTFFEMLGNFSFGDYFKQDAIAYAWELLTKVWEIDPARLYVTIFEGNESVPRDDEAEQFWIATGVPKERIFGMSAKDNFWQMGDTGPCGPCSEIFYDLGPSAAEQPGIDKPFPQDDQRYIEIWNLVFMQFDRATDGTLTPLPKPSIDTGMGLERIAAVLQGKLSNYQSDLFTPLIARAAELTNSSLLSSRSEAEGSASPGSLDALALSDERGAASLRIIADHARAATFLISDGLLPSNEHRGYVLRKIIRRAIRHGRLLGQEQPFLHRMVFAVRDEMRAAYPELNDSAERVSKVILAEEQQFARVLATALLELESFLRQREKLSNFEINDFLRSELLRNTKPGYLEFFNQNYDSEDFSDYHVAAAAMTTFYGPVVGPMIHLALDEYILSKSVFKGEDAFHLYETYGLPVDFMLDAARDAHLEFDMTGFERAREEEQARARASWKGGSQKSAAPVYRELAKTEFVGYGATRLDGARILALVKDGEGVQTLAPGEIGEAILDATSFYANSGGQVGDVGWLYAADHHTAVAEVTGCTKPVAGVFAHQLIAKQTLAVGDTVDTVVNAGVRHATMRNHTATHLLQAALRQTLGTHVKQAGSLNNSERLRFDFSHFNSVADEELAEIEDTINTHVLANTPVQTLVDVPIDEAIHDLGATALFGEKYGDLVRVVKVGDFSVELCGGTHTAALGEIGLVKLTGEGAVSSGVRRVEAITGTGSLAEFRRDFATSRAASHFAGNVGADALRTKLSQQDEELRKLRRELEQMRLKSATAATANAAESAVDVSGIKVLAQRVEALDKSAMRNLADELRGKLGSGVVVLGAATADGKVALIAAVTKDLTSRIQAGKLVGALAAKVGGKGGGRPDLAEAGGTDANALDSALQQVPSLVGSLLS